MSGLELLPTELLHDILLYSRNVNLARTSPVIGGKLSSEHTYVQLVLNAIDGSMRFYTRREPNEEGPIGLNGEGQEVTREMEAEVAVLGDLQVRHISILPRLFPFSRAIFHHNLFVSTTDFLSCFLSPSTNTSCDFS